MQDGSNATREQCKRRFCNPKLFRRAYLEFVGKALAQGQDESDDSAIDDLYQAVLIAPTLEDLKPAIIAATKGCTVGIHYAGVENKWMKETIGYQGQMVDLAQVIHRFFTLFACISK